MKKAQTQSNRVRNDLNNLSIKTSINPNRIHPEEDYGEIELINPSGVKSENTLALASNYQ